MFALLSLPPAPPHPSGLEQLYKKVADLEAGLMKLLNGSVITPQAATALVASLNKVVASAPGNSSSAGDGALDTPQQQPGCSSEPDNKQQDAAAAKDEPASIAPRDCSNRSGSGPGDAEMASSVSGSKSNNFNSHKSRSRGIGSCGGTAHIPPAAATPSCQQQGASTEQVTTTGVAVAMQVLKKAEERLAELQVHEARLKVRSRLC